MKCDRAMERYLSAEDINGSIPPDVRKHIEQCPQCRAEAESFAGAMNEMLRAQDLMRTDDIAAIVMARVSLEGDVPAREVPVYQWVCAGMILFGGMMLVTFSDSLVWLKSVFGRNIEVPMSLVLGIIITIYASIFVATHLDALCALVRIDRNGDERLP
jgi:hypothetical protein